MAGLLGRWTVKRVALGLATWYAGTLVLLFVSRNVFFPSAAPPPVWWSSVSLRQLDSFAVGEPSHLDLFNVMVHEGTVHLHVFDPSKEAGLLQTLVEDGLPPYLLHIGKLPVPRVVVHDTPLDLGQCATVSNASAFFFVPCPLNNLYHLHTSNIMALASVLLTSPGCSDLPCEDAMPRRVLYSLVPENQPLTLPHVQVLRGMFGNDLRNATELWTGGAHCIRHLSWGPGAHLLSASVPHYVHDTRTVLAALRRFALSTFAGALALPAGERHDREPLVVFVTRDCAASAGRCMQDRSVVLEAMRAVSSRVEVCCDFGRDSLESMLRAFKDADVVVGLHGAGLANAIYARPQSVLVELVGSFGKGADYYERLSLATGGYVRARVNPNNTIAPELAHHVAHCALEIWKGADPNHVPACTQHPGIQQALGINHTVPWVEDDSEANRTTPLRLSVPPCDAVPACSTRHMNHVRHSIGMLVAAAVNPHGPAMQLDSARRTNRSPADTESWPREDVGWV